MERDSALLLDMLIVQEGSRLSRRIRHRRLPADEEKQYAVVHAIQIVGEAAGAVSPAARDAHPEIPWNAIVGMRHRLVHDYLNVDPQIVWDTVANDLPPLIRVLEAIVPGQ